MSEPVAPAAGDSADEGAELEAIVRLVLETHVATKTEEAKLLRLLCQALEEEEPALDAAAQLARQVEARVTGGAASISLLAGLLRRLGVVGGRRRLERLMLGRRAIGRALVDAMDRMALRNVGAAPEVRGEEIVWRSDFSPRRHELVLPTRHFGDLAWARSKVHARRATGRARLSGVVVGAADLVQLLEGQAELEQTTREEWPARLGAQAPDFFVIDSSVKLDVEDVLRRCDALGILPIVWVTTAPVASGPSWPAYVPLLSASAELATKWAAESGRPCVSLLSNEAFVGDPSGPAGEQQARAAHQRRRWERGAGSKLAIARRFAAACGLPPLSAALPRVSVLCVSNRAERFRQCLQMFDRQTYPHKELVYMANLDHLADDMLVALADRPDITLLRSAGELSLGEGLNRARAAASGELWAKMDDDDHYGPQYLVDQVAALEASGAAVVGKGTFYTYVRATRALYLTAEGPENGRTERYVQGGTILCDRQQVDGVDFPPVRRGTDTLFLQQCKLLGLQIHSTDRFNFAYVRYDEPGHHTFDVSTKHYLRKSELIGQPLELDSVEL
jgi:hypothetical protein